MISPLKIYFQLPVSTVIIMRVYSLLLKQLLKAFFFIFNLFKVRLSLVISYDASPLFRSKLFKRIFTFLFHISVSYTEVKFRPCFEPTDQCPEYTRRGGDGGGGGGGGSCM